MRKLFATLVIVCGVAAADAAGAETAASVGPRELARAIEQRSGKTSFADLERFAQAALDEPGREGLNRLYHAAWVFLNQGEYDRFKKWNDALAARAKDAGDRRYAAVAELNELRARYEQGDAKARERVLAVAQDEPDWFARTHALRLEAVFLLLEGRTGLALRRLADAENLVPKKDRYAGAALSGVWEVRGVALRALQDLDGSAAAFWKSEFVYADRTYPRPDFDPIHSLTSTALLLGDQALAEDLFAVHRRLAARADIPGVEVWTMDLCAAVAEGRDSPRDVLKCLEPLGSDPARFGQFGLHSLPMRAIAHARLGRVTDARRDLQMFRKFAEDNPAAQSFLPRIEAEVLKAEGRPAEAYEKLRTYYRDGIPRVLRGHSKGLKEFTTELEAQLAVRQEQLASAEANGKLRQQVIGSQRALMGVGALVLLLAVAAAIWQFRVSRDLRAARAKAEAASRTKSEFLANMSHEIRTPLNGVVGMADLLAGEDLSEKQREFVETIQGSGRTLERLLGDILDLARIEAGEIVIEQESFDLGQLIRSVAALTRMRADEKGVEVAVEIAPELDRRFVGDGLRIRQVLTNLMSNAVKFTDEGRVTVSAEAGGSGRVRLTVADTGIGFDMQNMDRVFGRFQQADGSITRRFGGTGLGLAISRHLVELMGGALGCESTVGVGSKFWLELPLAEGFGATDDAGPVESSDAAPLQLGKVLLADDHPINRKVAEMILAGAGAQVCCVANGAEALEAFRREAFDLVLMDMQMPVMDGLSATRRIRELETAERAARTPVLMLTANALPEHIEAGRAAGADGHVAKPISVQGLLSAIARVLDRPEQRATAA